MALEQKLSLKLTQKLVMTPSLQQAIKLLQMTRMELQTVLAQELVENPLLEEAEEVREEEVSEAEGEGKEKEAAEQDRDESLADLDLESYFGNVWEGPNDMPPRELREAPPLENTLTREPDLYDHLLWQLHMSAVDGRQRRLCELIIGNLNPDGFLMASLEELQRMGEQEEDATPFSEREVLDALAVVRCFDPPGIACWSLQESLLQQLAALGFEDDSLAVRLVSETWGLLMRRQLPAAAKALGVPLADLQPAFEQIRELETRPGRKYSSERPHYIEPDVAVVRVGDEYVIQLNDDGMPRLRISRAYRRMLQEMKRDRKDSDARQFIREKMRSALWLIKSLDQRQRTIYKVAESIVRQQREFLDRGVDALRPMVLRDVAEDIGMHESTVSRVVSNKYMHTPRGLFPMKYFFHSGIDRDYGGDISSVSVKRKIRQIIEGEDRKKPYSDSALMKILRREGIHIARRTVAKYRDELRIPSSADRKQIF